MDSPVISYGNLVGNNLTLSGYVGSAANQSTFANCRVEFFISDLSSANGSGKTYLGFLTSDANGNFSGTLDVTGLGMQTSDAITATATDAAGNTSEFGVNSVANLTPTAVADANTAVEAGGTLNGTAGTNPTGNVVTNDTDPNSGDTKTVVGIVAGTFPSAAANVGTAVTGTYGSINIAANGSYIYTVDNTNSTVQALRTSAQTLTDVFSYTMNDASGVASTTQITVTIQGANDTPVPVNDTNTAVEAGGVSNGTAGTNPTGNVLTNDTDVDSVGNGETKTVSGVAAGAVGSAVGSVGSSVTGTYGSMNIDSTGAYTYTVDNTIAAVQALRLSGQTLSDTFTYQMTDAGGLSALGTVTITIQGANDNPVGVADTGTATEASGYANATAGSNATGNVLTNDTDVDSAANGETNTVTGVAAGTVSSSVGSVSSVVHGSYGSITINGDGTYSYVVNESNATVQALRLSSQTITDVFTYTVTDAGGLNSTTQVTITIQGGNDAPVGVDDTATAVEAGGLSNGTAGTNPTGNVLTNDTDVDSNANGETKTVSGVAAGAVGTTALQLVGDNVTGTYGSINIGADGSYTYTVDDSNTAVQALRLTSQTLIDLFTYEVVDTGGLTSLATVTITIQGSNDNPVAVVDNGDAIEAGGITNGTAGSNGTGNVLANDTDVDSNANGETKTVTGVAAGTLSSSVGSVSSVVHGSYGSITINADGSYTYVIDNTNAAVQALRLNGQTLDDVFTYTVTDTGGLTSTTQVTVTVHGRNDNPVGNDDTNTAVEAGGVANGTSGTTPNGNVLTTDTDVDSVAIGETKTV